jgi:hypothetical protein
MWQLAANIVIGLIMIAVVFTGALAGILAPFFIWAFAGGSAAIVLLSCWGLYDELTHEEDVKGIGLQ